MGVGMVGVADGDIIRKHHMWYLFASFVGKQIPHMMFYYMVHLHFEI